MKGVTVLTVGTGEKESSGKSCDVKQVLTAEQIISKHMSA